MMMSGIQVLAILSLWVFIAVKVAGTALAAWSWWWLLLPSVPVAALFLGKFGLL